MMNRQDLREDYWDILRGIAIALVVIGHSMQSWSGEMASSGTYWDYIWFKMIYGFHMPIFALISGYFMYNTMKRDAVSIFISKTKSLLLPILVWGGIDTCILLIKEKKITLLYVLQTYRYFLGSSLWFLWALYGCALIVIIVNKLFKDNIYLYFLIIILSPFITDAKYLGAIKFLFPYYVLGYFVKKHNHRIRDWLCSIEKRKTYFGQAMTLILYYLAIKYLYNYNTYFYTTGITVLKSENVIWQLGIDCIRLLIGILGCISIMIVANTLILVAKKWNLLSVFTKALKMLGYYSMAIYILNWRTIALGTCIAHKTSGSWWNIACITIIAIVIYCVMAIFLYKTNLIAGLLFGKWSKSKAHESKKV